MPPTKIPVAWKWPIHFIATDGRELYGEPLHPTPGFDLGQSLNSVNLEAKLLQGEDIYDTTGATKVTDEISVVKKILGPVTSRDMPFLRCIGVNCAAHSMNTLRFFKLVGIHHSPMPTVREANRKSPPFPSMFYKPPGSVIGPNEDVVIPKITQDNGADYEGENWNVAEHSWIRMNRTCAQCYTVVIAEIA